MAHQARSRFYSAMMRQGGNPPNGPPAATMGPSSVPPGGQDGATNATVNTSPSPTPSPTPAPAPPADDKKPDKHKDMVPCTNKKTNETIHCPKENPKCCNSAYCILQQYNVFAFMFGMTLIELVMN